MMLMPLVLALLTAPPHAPAPTPPALPGPARPAVSPAAREVDSLVQEGKLDDAVERGRAGIAASPDDVDLRLATARALAAKARRFSHVVNVKVTAQDIERGQVKVPGTADDGPLEIGYDAAPFEEAVLDLDEGIKRAPKREDLRVFKCFLLTDAARVDRARAAIADALSTLPKTPELAKTMIAYGAERQKRGDGPGAALLMGPVAAAFPGNAAVQSDYGNALTRLGRKEEAYSAFDKAVAAAPLDLRVVRAKATAAMLLRDFPAARTDWDAAHRTSRDAGDALASAAAAYGIDPKAATQLFNELAAPSPGANPALGELAHLFALAGTAGPGSQAAISLARRLVDANQHVLAIPVLERAVRADPKNGEAKALLAKVYDDFGCSSLLKDGR